MQRRQSQDHGEGSQQGGWRAPAQPATPSPESLFDRLRSRRGAKRLGVSAGRPARRAAPKRRSLHPS
jgi:hypothetical protein